VRARRNSATSASATSTPADPDTEPATEPGTDPGTEPGTETDPETDAEAEADPGLAGVDGAVGGSAVAQPVASRATIGARAERASMRYGTRETPLVQSSWSILDVPKMAPFLAPDRLTRRVASPRLPGMMARKQDSGFHLLFKMAVGFLVFGATVGLEGLRHLH
jgi:hypothetical protein